MSHMIQLPFASVNITDGFWRRRQDINADVTLGAILERFRDTGRVDALKCKWKEGDEHKPHIFWDSDIAKWIEGASYVMQKTPNAALEAEIDTMVADIAAQQRSDGYYNAYYNVCETGQEFTKRVNHELYCIGHMIEGAIAYHQATGKDALLNIVKKMVDYVERVFVIENSAGFMTPGHQEIELALYKLYKHTGEEKYLKLCQFFLDKRGSNDKDTAFYDFATAHYDQSHKPVREQEEAFGHSVRAMYMYCAMADVAYECGDTGLQGACGKLWDDVTLRKMYITGGIGSASQGEAFTVPYDLPNLTTYTETCAAIGLAMFALRMSRLQPRGVYADIAERVMYNGALSGISLDGDSFFYTNAQELDLSLYTRHTSTHTHEYLPEKQRSAIFGCSCCPPNILRFIASIGDYIYSKRGDTLFVHQYIANTSDVATITTQYPNDGTVVINADASCKTVAVRIPGWCAGFHINKAYDLVDGYAYIANVADGDLAEIRITFDMPVRLIEANPLVQDTAGRVAVTRGPLVYCLEGVDNGGKLRDISIDTNTWWFRSSYDETYGAAVLQCTGYRRPACDELYRPHAYNAVPVELTFIPYYAFANRGETDMIIWVMPRK